MEKLHQVEKEFAGSGKRLAVIGLDNHAPFSKHPFAARWAVPQTAEVGA